jgi:hypothetical protein
MNLKKQQVTGMNLRKQQENNLLLLTLIDAGSGWFQNVTAATGLVQDNVRM